MRDENLPNMSSDWLIHVVFGQPGFISVLLHQNLRRCPFVPECDVAGHRAQHTQLRREATQDTGHRRCAFNPETYLCMPFRSFSLPNAFLACVGSFIVAQTIAQTRVFGIRSGWTYRNVCTYAVLMTRPRTLSLYISPL